MKNKFMTTIITSISTLCISVSMFNYAPTAFASDSERNVSSPAVTELLMGDTDGNGTFNAADILTFKNWMLSDSDNSLDSWRAADLSWDGRLNIVDYCLMKNALLSPSADANVYDLLFGYYENGYSKPLPSQKIALKCKSFCNLNEKLTIDVAMGDESTPDYDAPGHAEYGIHAFEGSSYMNKADEKLIINGESSKYKKVFSKDELESLDISGKFAEYGSYHHETAEIDFSNCKPGDSGEIVFYFHWEYEYENPYDPANKTVGMDKVIGFYVGEKGIALGTSADDAMNRYQELFSLLPDEDNDLSFGYYDKNYS